MRHDPAGASIIIMLRSLKLHGMAHAVDDLVTQGVPAFEAATPGRLLAQRRGHLTANHEIVKPTVLFIRIDINADQPRCFQIQADVCVGVRRPPLFYSGLIRCGVFVALRSQSSEWGFKVRAYREYFPTFASIGKSGVFDCRAHVSTS